MNMKIKIKNKDNKLFVALVLIAALMMVSVAGVVMSDDAKATPSYYHGDFTIEGDFSNDLFIYGDAGSTITIGEDANYTGTLSYGNKIVTDSGDVEYIELSSITLTNASDLIIEAASSGQMEFIGEYTGEIVLITGSIKLGTSTDAKESYTGTIKAGSATITAEKVKGVVIIVKDGDATISGTITMPTAPDGWATDDDALPYSILTIAGEAYLGNMTITDSGASATKNAFNLIIDAGADVSTSKIKTYDGMIEFHTLDTFAATGTGSINSAVGTATDDNGNIIAGVFTVGTAIASPSYITFPNMDINETYTIELTYTSNVAAAAVTYVYYGEMNFVAVPSTTTYTQSLQAIDDTTTRELKAMLAVTGDASGKIALTFPSNIPTIAYYSTDVLVSAKAVSQFDGTTYFGVADENKITFPGIPTKGGLKYDIFVVVINGPQSATAVEYVYAGVMTNGSTTLPTIPTIADDVTDEAAAITDIGGTQTLVPKEYVITTNGLTTVNGELVFNKNLSTGILTPLTISANGKVNFGVDGIMTFVGSTLLANSGKVNAAIYEKEISDVDHKNYTTLDNAMKNSDDISISGDLKLKVDITLTGNSTATTVSNDITILTGAVLTIGVLGDANAEPAIEAVKVTVTVPSTTKLIIDNNGLIEVKYGQLDWAGKTGNNNRVNADVLMEKDSTGVYADIATALALAADGNELDLRQNTTISTVTEVKSGVTFNDKGKDIEIAKGGKLTVSGKYNSATGATLTILKDGEFVVNSNDVSLKGVGIVLIGTLTINANAEFTLASTKTIVVGIAAALPVPAVVATKTNPAVINVNGTFTNKGTIDGLATNYATLNVNGKYVGDTATTGSIKATIEIKVVVTGEFNAQQAEPTIDELIVTGSGKVTAKDNTAITVGVAYIGDNTSGDAITGTNNTEVTITLLPGTTAHHSFAAVYGTPAEGKVDITNGNVTTKMYFGAEDLYATLYAIDVTVANNKVLINDMKEVFKTGSVFNALYFDSTLTNLVGSGAGVDEDHIGGVASVYAKMTPMQYKVSLQYAEGIKWLFDNKAISEDATISYLDKVDYGQHSVSFALMDGYSGDVKLTMDGQTYTAGKEFLLDSDTVFIAEGAHKTVPGDSIDVIEILLVVITIVFVIVAVVVIMRLMRS